jgi:hypothetical protein
MTSHYLVRNSISAKLLVGGLRRNTLLVEEIIPLTVHRYGCPMDDSLYARRIAEAGVRHSSYGQNL